MARLCGTITVALIASLASAQLSPAGPPKAAPVPSPLASIAWMAGHWTAEAKSPGSGALAKVDTHYTPEMDDRTMTIQTSFDGKLVYQGMFAYDPAQKAIAFWYVTPEGESIRGTVDSQKGQGEFPDQLYDFHMTMTNGVDLHFHTLIHRTDADHYVWTLFTTNEGTKWDKLTEVNYRRVP